MELQTAEWMVKFVRKIIENAVEMKKTSVPESYPKELNEKKGVFVTLLTYPEKELRGCIGLPYPTHKLIEGIIEAAFSACFDPRFSPLRKEELNKIIVEVSILTPPKLIEVKSPDEYLEKVEIGKDGLIIANGPFSGLLLPQVPVEYKWDVKEFLRNLCLKASLPPDAWRYPTSRIYKFQAEIFAEEEPNGRIVRREIKVVK